MKRDDEGGVDLALDRALQPRVLHRPVAAHARGPLGAPIQEAPPGEAEQSLGGGRGEAEEERLRHLMVLPELLVVHRADARQRAVRDERDGARGVIHLRDEHLHQRTELHALAHGLEHLLKSRQEDPGVHRDVRHLAHVRVTRADLLRSDHLQRGRELREAIKRGFTPVVRASDVPTAAAAAARALARARAAAAVRAVRVPIRAGGAAETRVAVRAHRRLRAEIGRGEIFLSGTSTGAEDWMSAPRASSSTSQFPARSRPFSFSTPPARSPRRRPGCWRGIHPARPRRRSSTCPRGCSRRPPRSRFSSRWA